MKHILVTGGCGFMGSNFIRHLRSVRPDVEITNLDLLTYAGNAENLSGIDERGYHFVEGDIADKDLVQKLMAKVDTVINFAAETHVDRSIHGTREDFIHTNIVGVHILLEALRGASHVNRMVHVSTDEVWGDLALSSTEKFTEDSPFKPNSPYAASKASGDLLTRAYAKTYNLPVSVTHSVNNFGPRQFPEKLIPFFTLLTLQDQPLPLYGKGENVRDWLYVDDHSSAMLTILEKGKPGEVYAVSAGEELANIDIAKKILGRLGKPTDRFIFVEDRPAHDTRYSVDSSKLRSLGWKPRSTFDDKLDETIQWYRDHKEWLKNVTARNTDINPHIKEAA